MAVNWDAVKDRLGTVPDRVIAKMLGVSHQAVHYKRDMLGIKASRPYGQTIPNADELVNLPSGRVKVRRKL